MTDEPAGDIDDTIVIPEDEFPTWAPPGGLVRPDWNTPLWESFQKQTQNHQMTIIHDDRIHRHIRLREPGTRMWGWDVVTWPGHLAISGDIADGYVFAHPDVYDMLGFFRLRECRNPGEVPTIDMGYWSEKLCGASQKARHEYSDEHYAYYVGDQIRQAVEDDVITSEQATKIYAEAMEHSEFEHEAMLWLLYAKDSWYDRAADAAELNDLSTRIFPDTDIESIQTIPRNLRLAMYCLAWTATAYWDWKETDGGVAPLSITIDPHNAPTSTTAAP